ncbi:redoxin domain-containing protein [Ornithinibacillus sp. L9]|uniref:Redoxin domain-containing protein n=1 Tax=Ornithinibacillus caprae TaxID=2678566 RepID=A0A6N8FM27_9BACI|nr:TlpA disulfide reductase family protein [Ornithinibacillus caprae]MUK90672.1 redoxin domain-containing protein [Ornithinibacillus caprae]
MIKQILGTALIAVLGIILVMNMLNMNKESSTNEYDVTGDTEAEGVAIGPPGSSGLEVGELSPDFELKTLEGETIRLSDLLGKKIMLNFWATWCPPCLKEMPEMQEFYDEHGDEIEILAVNVTGSEKNEQAVHDFIDEYSYTFPILLDTAMNVSDEYKAITIPTTYFIGTDGTIQHPRKAGPMTYEFMEEMLEELN